MNARINNLPPPRHYSKSSSFIMAIIFTVLCGAAVLILGYFGYYFTRGYYVYSTEAVIDTEIKYITKFKDVDELQSTDDRLYALFGEDGSHPAAIPNDVSLLSEGIITFEHSENGQNYAGKIHTFEDGKKLLVAVNMTELSEQYRFLRLLSVLSIVFMVLVIAVSYLISAFVVKETNNIANTANEIVRTGDLSRRLDVGSRWDDLGNMAAVLNVLLDRIQGLMQGVRQVSDNIAHDLRTPLTRLRGHVEDLQKKDPKPEYEDLLHEADHILKTFGALLRISRIEAEKQKSQFCDVNLKEIMQDVVSFYEPLAEDKSISLNHDFADAPYKGDRDLLFQAYANLIDNALKYTPENGTIYISVENEAGHIIVRISDTGVGVSEDEKEKIFERFYRTEKCRSTQGTGLGLSLVAAVIDLHNGQIEVYNQDPGLEIITIL